MSARPKRRAKEGAVKQEAAQADGSSSEGAARGSHRRQKKARVRYAEEDDSDEFATGSDEGEEAAIMLHEAAVQAQLSSMPQPVPAFMQAGPDTGSPHVGGTISKEFDGHGLYSGLVTSMSDGMYLVFYPSDGECESMPESQLERLNPQPFTPLTRHEVGTVSSILERRAIPGPGIKVWEYLVHWRGRSHWHDSWVMEEMANMLAGAKMLNFNRKYPKEDDPDPEIDGSTVVDGTLAVLESWRTVQRVVAKRNATIGRPKGRLTEFLVKWQGLDYSHCTWEPCTARIPEKMLLDFERKVAADVAKLEEQELAPEVKSVLWKKKQQKNKNKNNKKNKSKKLTKQKKKKENMERKKESNRDKKKEKEKQKQEEEEEEEEEEEKRKKKKKKEEKTKKAVQAKEEAEEGARIQEEE